MYEKRTTKSGFRLPKEEPKALRLARAALDSAVVRGDKEGIALLRRRIEILEGK